jgi:hypothetical protein
MNINKTVVFEGSPEEIGCELFIQVCMPIVREAQARLGASPQQLAQLYAGFICAALGSMAADFGQASAISLAEEALGMFKKSDLGAEARSKSH